FGPGSGVVCRVGPAATARAAREPSSPRPEPATQGRPMLTPERNDPQSTPEPREHDTARPDPASRSLPGLSPGTMLRTLAAQGGTGAMLRKIQRRAQARQARADDAETVQAAAAHGTSDGGGPLPFHDEIQRSFGHHDVGSVQAHTGPQAAAASQAMQAE